MNEILLSNINSLSVNTYLQNTHNIKNENILLSGEHIKYGETNKKLILDEYRDKDFIEIEGIKINFNDINYIKNISIIIGGSSILDIDFSILYNLTKNNNIDQNNIITIYFPKYLFLLLPIITTMYHDMYFLVESELITNIPYKLILKNIFLDSETKLKYQNIYESHFFIYNILETCNFLNNNKIDLSNFIWSKGFYLESYGKVENIKLILDDTIIYNYNKDEINNHMCKNPKNSGICITINKINLPDEILDNVKEYLDIPYIYWFSFISSNTHNSIKGQNIKLNKSYIEFTNNRSGKIINLKSQYLHTRSGLCRQFIY